MVAIGLSIGLAAVVGRALGPGSSMEARRLAAAGLLLTVMVAVLAALATALTREPVLQVPGTTGETRRLAARDERDHGGGHAHRCRRRDAGRLLAGREH